MRDPIKGNCNALCFIGDDYGDNHAACRCGLLAGHEGKHEEVCRDGDLEIRWVKDEREVCEFHGLQEDDCCRTCMELRAMWEEEIADDNWLGYTVSRDQWDEAGIPPELLVWARSQDNTFRNHLEILKHPEHGWFAVVRESSLMRRVILVSPQDMGMLREDPTGWL